MMKNNAIKYLAAAMLMGSASVALAQGKVIFTGELAKHVQGYAGPTPLHITVDNGKITAIEADAAHRETPRYYKKAQKKIFPQYIGKTVEEALALQPDGATGATYSANAIVENIKIGLKDYQKTNKKSTSSKKKSKKKRK
ncbi:MAG: FMN-binding protein [Bacteroidales bacterium]|nr:FMN-binding protein [Bacteroidales bacterium]